MTFSERSNFTLFRPTTAMKLGPAVTMATAEPLNHAESPERARKSAWLARDTPGGARMAAGCFSAGEPRWDVAHGETCVRLPRGHSR